MVRLIVVCGLSLLFVAPGVADDSAFKVGFAKRDITPQRATPMWGYGAWHAMLSQGTADPLMAKAVVIEAGNERLGFAGKFAPCRKADVFSCSICESLIPGNLSAT